MAMLIMLQMLIGPASVAFLTLPCALGFSVPRPPLRAERLATRAGPLRSYLTPNGADDLSLGQSPSPSPSAITSRRGAVLASVGTVAAILVAEERVRNISDPSHPRGSGDSPAAPAPAAARVAPLGTVGDALRLIDGSCDRGFLHAVVSSDYRFMYRGVPPAPDGGAATPAVRSEPCDLLDPSTYGSEGAGSYFRELDDRMRKRGDPVRPGNGHLATTSLEEASAWGDAASIWPLGGNVHFAWYDDGGNFWPDHDSTKGSRGEVIVDGIDCGKMNLADALEGKNVEILFRADKFLAVPASMETELREGLRNSFII